MSKDTNLNSGRERQNSTENFYAPGLTTNTFEAPLFPLPVSLGIQGWGEAAKAP